MPGMGETASHLTAVAIEIIDEPVVVQAIPIRESARVRESENEGRAAGCPQRGRWNFYSALGFIIAAIIFLAVS